MLIGVISDTHDNVSVAEKANRFFKDMKVDLLFHLGDFVSPFTFKRVFDGFKGRGYGVLGNNDGEKMILFDLASRMDIVLKSFPYIIDVGGKRFLIAHGFGSNENTLEIIKSLFYSGRYDAVLFGHTHERFYVKEGNRIMVNPGEASGVLYGERTIALIDADDLKVEYINL